MAHASALQARVSADREAYRHDHARHESIKERPSTPEKKGLKIQHYGTTPFRIIAPRPSQQVKRTASLSAEQQRPRPLRITISESTPPTSASNEETIPIGSLEHY